MLSASIYPQPIYKTEAPGYHKHIGMRSLVYVTARAIWGHCSREEVLTQKIPAAHIFWGKSYYRKHQLQTTIENRKHLRFVPIYVTLNS